MSLEKRMAEINPAAAQVGIFNEKILPSPKSQRRNKAAALTGRLEVNIVITRTISIHGRDVFRTQSNILRWSYLQKHPSQMFVWVLNEPQQNTQKYTKKTPLLLRFAIPIVKFQWKKLYILFPSMQNFRLAKRRFSLV